MRSVGKNPNWVAKPSMPPLCMIIWRPPLSVTMAQPSPYC
jgi:hypothetical protein